MADEVSLSDSGAFARHGGALDHARRLFPDAPEPWIDLSTGINPVPYPVGSVASDAWTRLPEAGALAALEAEAARRYGCAAWIETIAAPGTQAIIQRLPALLAVGAMSSSPPREAEERAGLDPRPSLDARLLGRTYGEYARVLSEAGAATRTVDAIADLAGADVAIVVNPNNPDGRLTAPDALARIAGEVGALVVDEAFVDVLPGWSLAPRMPARRAIVLRSFGKAYGLAGLRLGFALATPDLAPRLRAMLGPWAVSGPAIAIGTRALADDAWIADNRAALGHAAARLDALLIGAGFGIVGGTPLFRLAGHPDAPTRFKSLARAGILTRPFADAPTWLRFGLPAGEPAWARLARALTPPAAAAGTFANNRNR